MEHEYYTGLSLLVMVYIAATKFGPNIAKWLDKEVDVRIFKIITLLHARLKRVHSLNCVQNTSSALITNIPFYNVKLH